MTQSSKRPSYEPTFQTTGKPSKVLLLNKPFGVLCQFTDSDNRQTLADFIKLPGFYAAGRLDRDSEGLLVLTSDGKLQHRIANPENKLEKTYLIQVEGDISDQAIESLCKGITLKDGITRPARASKATQPDWLWPRNPPIRERKSIPTSWLELHLKEGKNRQARRMTAATGFPTLRLIRTDIGPWSLDALQPGQSMFAPAHIKTS